MSSSDSSPSVYAAADRTSSSLVRCLVFLIFIAMCNMFSLNNNAILSALLMVSIYWIGLIGVRRRHTCALATFVTLATIVVTLVITTLALYAVAVGIHMHHSNHNMDVMPQGALPQKPLALTFANDDEKMTASPLEQDSEIASLQHPNLAWLAENMKVAAASAENSEIQSLQHPNLAWLVESMKSVAASAKNTELLSLQHPNLAWLAASQQKQDSKPLSLQSSSQAWFAELHKTLTSFDHGKAMLVKLQKAGVAGADKHHKGEHSMSARFMEHVEMTSTSVARVNYALLAVSALLAIMVLVIKIRSIVLALRLMRQLRIAQVVIAARPSRPSTVKMTVVPRTATVASKSPVGSHIPRVYFPNTTTAPFNARNAHDRADPAALLARQTKSSPQNVFNV